MVARLANAVLMDPQLNTHKAWKDASVLSDIFDVNFLRNRLSTIVKIAPEVAPSDEETSAQRLERLKPIGKITPPVGASAEWYVFYQIS